MLEWVSHHVRRVLLAGFPPAERVVHCPLPSETRPRRSRRTTAACSHQLACLPSTDPRPHAPLPLQAGREQDLSVGPCQRATHAQRGAGTAAVPTAARRGRRPDSLSSSGACPRRPSPSYSFPPDPHLLLPDHCEGFQPPPPPPALHAGSAPLSSMPLAPPTGLHLCRAAGVPALCRVPARLGQAPAVRVRTVSTPCLQHCVAAAIAVLAVRLAGAPALSRPTRRPRPCLGSPLPPTSPSTPQHLTHGRLLPR